MLLREAVEIERQRGAEVDAPALVGRRSLAEALEPTSKLRVEALLEEYPEARETLDALRGKPAKGEVRSLQVTAEQLGILIGTGVLRIDENGQYAVPDLYRHGLSMPRMGPR